MRAEDIIPFLAMAAYIALMIFKQRKKSGGDAKSRVDKKSTGDSTQLDRTQRDSRQGNFWDRIQGKTQDKIQGEFRQEKSWASFRESSKDPSKDWDRGEGEPPARAQGLFSKLGERLQAFFSELEQQFRMEAEKARMKDQMGGPIGQVSSRESEKSQAAEQGLFADFDHVDFQASAFTSQENDDEKGSRPVKTPKTPTTVRAKKQSSGSSLIKEPLRASRTGVNLTLSPDEIRTAVVWSEILGPPIALRTGKRPWEK